ncbi:RNA polymerase sigma factor [Puia dinghuensis]|uniref:RNA polymerase sigma factor n=1 Tax=Puia dinghuensis TaxID=1792502 RepID=A0A8J2UD29_9BACT|nr:sigma-70 family RNA polymerase sigma factor [Puia dinghuensis]GGA98104.1 RNA polymerase sigma factor [Puia dinghuensis]
MVETEELQLLINGCVKNDRASQEKLYKQFYLPLFSLCRRFFQNDHEAIESVNDGMLKVFEKVGSYRADKGRFFNWMYTIVRNTAVDKFRASVVIPTGDMEEVVETEGVGANPVEWLESKELSLLFDQLSPAPRGICNLFYIEGYAIREIADRLRVSTGTVRWHLSESRKKLKPIIDNYVNQ